MQSTTLQERNAEISFEWLFILATLYTCQLLQTSISFQLTNAKALLHGEHSILGTSITKHLRKWNTGSGSLNRIYLCSES